MPLVIQYWQGFPAASIFQPDQCIVGTQTPRVGTESPKPFLNQYTLDISGV